MATRKATVCEGRAASVEREEARLPVADYLGRMEAARAAEVSP